jgi:hypothetical protein
MDLKTTVVDGWFTFTIKDKDHPVYQKVLALPDDFVGHVVLPSFDPTEDGSCEDYDWSFFREEFNLHVQGVSWSVLESMYEELNNGKVTFKEEIEGN